jgi:hypothetical protein
LKCSYTDDSSYRLIFYLDKKDEIYHYSSKEHPKISKIAKYNPVKLENFEYFSITRGKMHHFRLKSGAFFCFFVFYEILQPNLVVKLFNDRFRPSCLDQNLVYS